MSCVLLGSIHQVFSQYMVHTLLQLIIICFSRLVVVYVVLVIACLIWRFNHRFMIDLRACPLFHKYRKKKEKVVNASLLEGSESQCTCSDTDLTAVLNVWYMAGFHTGRQVLRVANANFLKLISFKHAKFCYNKSIILSQMRKTATHCCWACDIELNPILFF